jgi:hypothetical protein
LIFYFINVKNIEYFDTESIIDIESIRSLSQLSKNILKNDQVNIKGELVVPKIKIGNYTLDGENGGLSISNNGKAVGRFDENGNLSLNKKITANTGKIGDWEIRENRIGIKDRGDINFHTDKWVRLLNYDSKKISDYVKDGGFAGDHLTSQSGKINGQQFKWWCC